VATNHSTRTFFLLLKDPVHCPAAHCFAMTHHFNLSLLYLEVQNYGPYQAKDQTWFTINNTFCTNTLQSNLKTSTGVIRILHNSPIIHTLTSIFPTINSVPDIFSAFVDTYALPYVYACKQAHVLCKTKDIVTVENSEFQSHVVKILKIHSKFQS
jgi:hypothetical protein